jgi:hypothetical protein
MTLKAIIIIVSDKNDMNKISIGIQSYKEGQIEVNIKQFI